MGCCSSSCRLIFHHLQKVFDMLTTCDNSSVLQKCTWPSFRDLRRIFRHFDKCLKCFVNSGNWAMTTSIEGANGCQKMFSDIRIYQLSGRNVLFPPVLRASRQQSEVNQRRIRQRGFQGHQVVPSQRDIYQLSERFASLVLNFGPVSRPPTPPLQFSHAPQMEIHRRFAGSHVLGHVAAHISDFT